MIASRSAARDPQAIAAIVEKTGARTFGATPATWRMMVDAGWRPTAGMEIHCAGEALLRDLANALTERGARLWNFYGPTEATVYASGAEVGPGRITIGRALQNVRLYVLDNRFEPAPVGVPGELFIGGAGVARGYLGRIELTAERFVPDPFAGMAGARMYRTGDVVRWLPTGEIDYLGRTDHQVKVRGFRIELGEIESVLAACDGVRNTVVVTVPDPKREKRIVAYLSPSSLDVQRLKETVARSLPSYMMPSAFVVLDEIPLTSSGKIDRKALPAPDFASTSKDEPAQNALERTVVEAFQEVLGVARIGVLDNFFELGGHSLLAAELLRRLQQSAPSDITLLQVFDKSTPRAIAELIRSSAGAAEPAQGLQRIARDQRMPLTSQETGMWFRHVVSPEAGVFNTCIAVRIATSIDRPAFSRALASLVARHEALRTRYVLDDEDPVRVVDRTAAPSLTWLTAGDPSDAAAQVRAIVQQPFDLAREALYRFVVVSLGPTDHVLAFAVHHLIQDARSLDIVFRDLAAFYAAEATGVPAVLPDHPFDYADYAAWERARPKVEVDENVAYFVKRLSGIVPVEIPRDRPRTGALDFAASRTSVALLPSESAALVALARDAATTPAVVFLAALAIFIQRTTHRTRFAIATIVSLRQHPSLEQVVGLFSNTVVIDFRITDDMPFAAVLRHVRERTHEALAHGNAPFERVVEQAVRERDPNQPPPLSEIIFDARLTGSAKVPFGGVAPEPFDAEVRTLFLDLYVSVDGDGTDPFVLEFTYASAYYDAPTADRFLRSYTSVLQAAVADCNTLVGAMPPAARVERLPAVPRASNRATREAVHASFEERARKKGSATALVMGDEAITHGALNRRANAVAGWLRSAGVQPGDRVLVRMPRSIERVIAVLGALKSGAACVPVEPEMPVERTRFVVEDSRPTAIVTTRSLLAELAPPRGVAVLCTDGDVDRLAQENGSDLGVDIDGHTPCFVLYPPRSGRGILWSHHGFAGAVRRHHERSPMPRDGVALQLASFGQGSTLEEAFSTWMGGGSLVLVDERTERDLDALLDVLDAQGVEGVFLMGSEALHGLAKTCLARGHAPACLRIVQMTGPRLEVTSEIAAFFELMGAEPALCHFYGIPEAPLAASVVFSGPPGGWPKATGTISGAGSSTDLYALDANLARVAPGAVGDLYIGGTTLADAYHGAPELTAVRFVPNPFGPPGTRLYRTADRARARADGGLDWVEALLYTTQTS